MSEETRRNHAQRCVHFTGVQHEVCKAGVRYDSFAKNAGLPCIRLGGARPGNSCDKKQLPTEEEIQKHEDEIEATLKRFRTVAPVIEKVKKEHKGTSWKGVEVCPVCNGRLHMTHAAYNGHVWGKCETQGCLAWME